MTRSIRLLTVAALGTVAAAASTTSGQVLGRHHLTWWDDPMAGVLVTIRNAPAPTPNAVPLFHMDEWHLDQPSTTLWYNGGAIAGLPSNPFNAANRNGMTAGSVIVPVAGSEAFVYQITNVNYFDGNGPPPFQAPPFSFTGGPGPGQNDLSGINIVDTHGALQLTPPAAGSQFMASSNLVAGRILDLTPGSLGIPASQDWDFNSYTGPGNWEWDIDTAGIGASIGLTPIVFGFAMPGNWRDAVNMGHVHSWTVPPGGVPTQVNVAGPVLGFSGPVIPTPSVGAAVLSGAALLASRRRRR